MLSELDNKNMPMDHPLSRRAALLLFAVVVLSWGMNWASPS